MKFIERCHNYDLLGLMQQLGGIRESGISPSLLRPIRRARVVWEHNTLHNTEVTWWTERSGSAALQTLSPDCRARQRDRGAGPRHYETIVYSYTANLHTTRTGSYTAAIYTIGSSFRLAPHTWMIQSGSAGFFHTVVQTGPSTDI